MDTYTELFETEVTVTDTGPIVRVIVGRGADAQIHEFPYSDIAMPDDPMLVPDDQLLERIERHMADVMEPGALRGRKVSRPAEGNVILVGAEFTYG